MQYLKIKYTKIIRKQGYFMDEKEMRLLIENFNSNLAELEKIQEMIKAKSYNTKITAAYGHNTGGASGSFSSKVENKIIDQDRLNERLRDYEKKVKIVLSAQKILTSSEREVIEFMKLGFEKVSIISRLIRKKYKFVYLTRKRALKKMCEYIGGNK